MRELSLKHNTQENCSATTDEIFVKYSITAVYDTEYVWFMIQEL